MRCKKLHLEVTILSNHLLYRRMFTNLQLMLIKALLKFGSLTKIYLFLNDSKRIGPEGALGMYQVCGSKHSLGVGPCLLPCFSLQLFTAACQACWPRSSSWSPWVLFPSQGRVIVALDTLHYTCILYGFWGQTITLALNLFLNVTVALS